MTEHSKIAPGAGSVEFSGPIDGELNLTPEDLVIEDDGVSEVGRSNSLIEQGGRPVEPAGQKATKSRGKKSKAAKSPKARIPVTSGETNEAGPGEYPVPLSVAVEFLRIDDAKQAATFARCFIEENFEAPNASYYYVQKWRDGFIVEMQMGGGKAFTPEITAHLDAHPEAVCAIMMAGRALQVRMDEEIGQLEALHLASGYRPGNDVFVALPSAKMTSFDRRGAGVFLAGMSLLAASFISVVFSVGAFFIDSDAWARPFLEQTPVATLPSAQVSKVKTALEGSECVAKMEFRGGSWSISPGWNDGTGKCTSTQPPRLSEPTAGETSLPPGEVKIDNAALVDPTAPPTL